MPTPPPVPLIYPTLVPKSQTESGLRYLSYALILFALSSAATIVFLIALFPLIAAMVSTPPGSFPDPSVFSSVIALIGAACALSLLSLVAGILGLIGLVLVYQGGDEFGPEHSKRVQRGLIVVIFGIVASFVGQTGVGFFAATSSVFPGSGFVPTFDPLFIWGQLAIGLLETFLLGLFLLWTVETLATPSGRVRATWAFIIGIVGVAAGSLGSLAMLAFVPFPPRLEDMTPWILAPAAISNGISIVSLVVWYLVYHDVLERFRTKELVARPRVIYYPTPPYYPGYYPPYPVPPAASPAQPQASPPKAPPEKPPST